jgi:hypothetical protein
LTIAMSGFLCAMSQVSIATADLRECICVTWNFSFWFPQLSMKSHSSSSDCGEIISKKTNPEFLCSWSQLKSIFPIEKSLPNRESFSQTDSMLSTLKRQQKVGWETANWLFESENSIWKSSVEMRYQDQKKRLLREMRRKRPKRSDSNSISVGRRDLNWMRKIFRLCCVHFQDIPPKCIARGDRTFSVCLETRREGKLESN